MPRRMRASSETSTPELRSAGPSGTRHVGLRPAADLPSRAKLFLVAAALVIAGFTAWVSVRLLDSDSRPLAILLIVLSAIGAIIVTIAVVTATRILFSLRALPYLLGRGVRRLLSSRH